MSCHWCVGYGPGNCPICCLRPAKGGCKECGRVKGHSPACLTKGYQVPPAFVAVGEEYSECLCGIHRGNCEYHRLELLTEEACEDTVDGWGVTP